LLAHVCLQHFSDMPAVSELAIAYLAVASLAALIAAADPVGATDRRSERSVESIGQRTAGEPVMAIVSLHSQRITVAASRVIKRP
jgi:ABC-type lipoprotein export system ATPase subunit